MQPNNEQIKSAIRWGLTTFGGILAGWLAAKGWDSEGIMALINSPAVIGLIATLIGGGWSLFSRSKVGILTAAAKLPEVKAIELAPANPTLEASKEVDRLAMSTPSEVRRAGRAGP